MQEFLGSNISPSMTTQFSNRPTFRLVVGGITEQHSANTSETSVSTSTILHGATVVWILVRCKEPPLIVAHLSTPQISDLIILFKSANECQTRIISV